MKQIKYLLYIILFQYATTFYALEVFHEDFMILKGIGHVWLVIIPLLLLISFIAIRGLIYLDKNVINDLVELEMNKRENAIDHYNEAVNVHNHELFRDLQMIKILAEDNDIEGIKKYIN
ncbi:hypothetical protein EZV73_23865 [Acidaminobacter sp. JC074]|uniref:hypothetical protein n=1 Tax=Acidaminobacter sp. JC074 TaxID=2530199 RepID=UPI001F0CF899|nr:hypothetical protein [Acidaminobacter sp. JC074]MCH4890640.1 hypothetical protein [Acidaminobacter sp. JC074]